MADNYLEKKMEELQYLKMGRKAPASVKSRQPKGVLYNKRVFITGGAQGIGRVIVRAFHDAGCRVAFCDRDPQSGKGTAQKFGAKFFHLDVTDKTALQECLDSISADWGDIDIVINNAGIGNFMPLAECSTEDFELVLKTNLLPLFITARHLARTRKEICYGRIINIASSRHAMSEAGTEAYSASKGAIVSITHALMMSLAPLGITVNAISPGWIECHHPEDIREIDKQFHPSGRVGKPEDIARIAIFLAHPDNDFINGENITIDGGVTKKMIYPE